MRKVCVESEEAQLSAQNSHLGLADLIWRWTKWQNSIDGKKREKPASRFDVVHLYSRSKYMRATLQERFAEDGPARATRTICSLFFSSLLFYRTSINNGSNDNLVGSRYFLLDESARYDWGGPRRHL